MAKLSKIDKLTEQELREIVSNSFSWRELYRNLGYASSNNSIKKTILSRLNKYNINTNHFTSQHLPKSIMKTEEEIFCLNTTAADNTVRSHFRKGEYVKYKCAICGLEPFWNGKKLTLTLDHINGNHNDSRLENLRWVCPNCDRQLETFAGKNYKTYHTGWVCG